MRGTPPLNPARLEVTVTRKHGRE